MENLPRVFPWKQGSIFWSEILISSPIWKIKESFSSLFFAVFSMSGCVQWRNWWQNGHEIWLKIAENCLKSAQKSPKMHINLIPGGGIGFTPLFLDMNFHPDDFFFHLCFPTFNISSSNFPEKMNEKEFWLHIFCIFRLRRLEFSL